MLNITNRECFFNDFKESLAKLCEIILCNYIYGSFKKENINFSINLRLLLMKLINEL